MDISYSSCMPFNTIYSAHITVLLQYIKPSESTLYLSKGSSKTMVILPGANIELSVSKSILSNIIHIKLLLTLTKVVHLKNSLKY